MAQLHWLSGYQAINSSGDVIVGAKLYTYEAGTTTNLATYSDNALSSANTNPLVSDANGYFGSIFVKPEDYKFVLKTAADVEIWSRDNANAEEEVARPIRWTGTASGTANAILLTAADAPAAYVNGQRFRFIAAASNTAAVTVNVNSIGVVDIVRAGGVALAADTIIANYPYEIEYVSAIGDFVIRGVDGLFSGAETAVVPADADSVFFTDASNGDAAATAIFAAFSHQAGMVFNASWSVTVAANVLTIALKTAAGGDPSTADPVRIGFRSATLTTSATSFVAVTSALSMTISAGSTLGFTADEAGRIYMGFINNAGTAELCAWRSLNGKSLFKPSQFALHTTTAEGGAGAADSAAVVYSTTARTSVALVIGGYFDITTGSTAGNWENAPTAVQTVGPGVPVTGDIVQEARTEYSAKSGSNTVMPRDATIPQVTEGNEYMTRAITPSNALNLLDIEALALLSPRNDTTVTSALFQVGTSDALTATINDMLINGARESPLRYRQVAGSTSSITFSFRAGASTAINLDINGVHSIDTTNPILGAIPKSFIQVTELFV
jgi:hypothetical protein